jgi:hypothetical protein
MALPPIPPAEQALLNVGNFREALKKGTIEVGKQVVKNGPRIVQPIAQITATTFRTLGMFAEADGVLWAGACLGTKASLLEAEAALALGWESILASGGTVVGTAVGAAEVIVPLLVLCLGIAFVMAVTSKPAKARELKKEYKNLSNELRNARPYKNKPWWTQLPKPGNA